VHDRIGLTFVPVLFHLPPMRYNAWRSHKDHATHVICRDDEFDNLPRVIKHMGPWVGSREGDIERLKPHYRIMLAEQGFAVVHLHPYEFAPEVN
jgi:hypothetical protein